MFKFENGKQAETPSEFRDLQNEALVREYVVIVDRSGSMKKKDGVFGTRWKSAQKAVTKIIDAIFKHDTDGRVPVYLFDDQVDFLGECTDSSHVKGVFESYEPRGTTDLARCLKVAMEKYSGTRRADYSSVPGTTFIVLLDGGADDEEAVRDVIRHYANPDNGYIRTHTDIAISFLQVGNDPGATSFLQGLDDDITGLPDIVDTKKASFLDTKNGVERLLLDAIFD
jgi:hypothetical protein